MARLVGSLGNNSMAKSIDAARRWPRAPRSLRLVLPRHAHTHTVCCPKVGGLLARLVGLVALVALVAPPASSAPSSSSAASKQKVKLNYFCNMQQKWRQCQHCCCCLYALPLSSSQTDNQRRIRIPSNSLCPIPAWPSGKLLKHTHTQLAGQGEGEGGVG